MCRISLEAAAFGEIIFESNKKLTVYGKRKCLTISSQLNCSCGAIDRIFFRELNVSIFVSEKKK